MNIEERLEKLTERHEALTQTVELLAGMHRDNEELFRRFQEESDKRFERADKRMGEVMETINQLGRIAGLHQELDDHEQRLDKLDGSDTAPPMP